MRSGMPVFRSSACCMFDYPEKPGRHLSSEQSYCFPLRGSHPPTFRNPWVVMPTTHGFDEFFGILYDVSAEQECVTAAFGRSPASIRRRSYIPSVKPLFTITLISTRRLRARP